MEVAKILHKVRDDEGERGFWSWVLQHTMSQIICGCCCIINSFTALQRPYLCAYKERRPSINGSLQGSKGPARLYNGVEELIVSLR